MVQTILLRTEPHPPNVTQTVTLHAVLNGDGADPLINTAPGRGRSQASTTGNGVLHSLNLVDFTLFYAPELNSVSASVKKAFSRLTYVLITGRLTAPKKPSMNRFRR